MWWLFDGSLSRGLCRTAFRTAGAAGTVGKAAYFCSRYVVVQCATCAFRLLFVVRMFEQVMQVLCHLSLRTDARINSDVCILILIIFNISFPLYPP